MFRPVLVLDLNRLADMDVDEQIERLIDIWLARNAGAQGTVEEWTRALRYLIKNISGRGQFDHCADLIRVARATISWDEWLEDEEDR